MSLGRSLMLVTAMAIFISAGMTDAVANPRGLGVCVTFVKPEGYECTEHPVVTNDGFRLQVERIVNSTTPPTLGPVLLYHGMMQGGDIWVLNPTNEALAFILADQGYEVFIGNGRSTIYSSHDLYERSDARFWDWSFDDLVQHDLPAFLSFISSLTSKKSLLVGYSQGSQVALGALSQPGNKALELIDKAALLGPFAYLNNIRAPLIQLTARLYSDQALMRTGSYEFSFQNAAGRELLGLVCRNLNCVDNLITYMTGPNCCINASRVPYYSMYETQSTSVRNVVHICQMVRSGRFAKYDYGVVGNIQRYGFPVAPSYNLAAIPSSIPMLLVHGGRDELADQVDVQHLIRDLRRTSVQVLFLPRYAHADFALSVTANRDIYLHVMDFFQTSQNQTNA